MNVDTRNSGNGWAISRRDFLKATGAAAAAVALPGRAQAAEPLRFGLVTDTHYADADPLGTRHYRESLGKLRECVDRMNQEKVAFMCELGDFKDQDREANEARTLTYLEKIEAEYKRFTGPRYYVLGNHDMDSLSKEQFLSRTAMPAPHYSFDNGEFHFIVLDACYLKDGTPYDHGQFTPQETYVSAPELEWLEKDLAAAKSPVIVFGHQRLDTETGVSVRNAAEVRAVLEKSGKVLGAFTGHDHPGGYTVINGIHYYTLIAVVEGSGEASSSYAVVEAAQSGDITITGYRRAVSKALARA